MEKDAGPRRVVVVRFADDFIVGFEQRHEVERFLVELRERFAKFGLELHPDKARPSSSDGTPERTDASVVMATRRRSTCSLHGRLGVDPEGAPHRAPSDDARALAGQA
jgi:hypothetical protein